MFRSTISKTALVLASSTVVLNSTSNGDSEKSWLEKLKTSFLGGDNVSQANPTFGKDKKDLTGWERLTIMYTRDEFGFLSKELSAVLYSTYTSLLVGGIYGTITKTKEAYTDFLERNQATQFANVFEARRTLQDRVFLAGMKGAFKYSMKLGFFTGGLLCCSISLMVYFDKYSSFYYAISAATMGTIHKWKQGPKGMFIGGSVGGILGLLAGGLTSGLFYITGTSMDDILQYQDLSMKYRDRQVSEVFKADKEKRNELTPLLKDHDRVVEEAVEEEKSVGNEVLPKPNDNVKT